LFKKRGNTLFKRDEHGNEIWVPEEANVLEVEKTAEGDVTVKTENRTRVIDDQSCEVPAVFAEWKRQEGLLW
jgi:type I restriction enzyme M protein